jgi:hypothetical protein
LIVIFHIEKPGKEVTHMWRSKKFIIIAVLVVLVVGGTVGGVAIAQANDEGNNTTQTANVTSFLDKVAEIYQENTGVVINADELQKAMTEATQAIKDEALDNYLQKLISENKITQEQADQYKAWLAQRPTFPTDEYKQWMDARPDIPGLFGSGNGAKIGPFGGMQRGMGKFGGMMRGGFRGWGAPDTESK